METCVAHQALCSLMLNIAEEIREGNLYSFCPLNEDRFNILRDDICGTEPEPKVLACLELANKLMSYEHFDHASKLLKEGIQICENEPAMKGENYYHESVLNLVQIMMNGYLTKEENAQGKELMEYLVKQFPQFEEAPLKMSQMGTLGNLI
jgi:hypothetical protein